MNRNEETVDLRNIGNLIITFRRKVRIICLRKDKMPWSMLKNSSDINRKHAKITAHNYENIDIDTIFYSDRGRQKLRDELTWKEHMRVSSTDIMPPALSNSPQ